MMKIKVAKNVKILNMGIFYQLSIRPVMFFYTCHQSQHVKKFIHTLHGKTIEFYGTNNGVLSNVIGVSFNIFYKLCATQFFNRKNVVQKNIEAINAPNRLLYFF